MLMASYVLSWIEDKQCSSYRVMSSFFSWLVMSFSCNFNEIVWSGLLHLLDGVFTQQDWTFGWTGKVQARFVSNGVCVCVGGGMWVCLGLHDEVCRVCMWVWECFMCVVVWSKFKIVWCGKENQGPLFDINVWCSRSLRTKLHPMIVTQYSHLNTCVPIMYDHTYCACCTSTSFSLWYFPVSSQNEKKPVYFKLINVKYLGSFHLTRNWICPYILKFQQKLNENVWEFVKNVF